MKHDDTDELIATFKPLGIASAKLVEKIFRDRQRRKLMGTAANGVEATVPSGALGSGPAPRDGVHRPCGSTDGIGGDAAIGSFAASDGTMRTPEGVSTDHHPSRVHSIEAAEAETPAGVSRTFRVGEETGERGRKG